MGTAPPSNSPPGVLDIVKYSPAPSDHAARSPNRDTYASAVAADALQMGGKVPLPPLVAQREQPELPDELASVESVEQAKLQPGRLAPLPSAATASANAIQTGSPPMWRKAPKEALEPIGR